MTESMLMKVMMDMAETLMVMMLARMIVMKVMMIMVEMLMMIILAGDDCDQCLNHSMAADDRVGRRVYGRRMPRPRQLISVLSRLPRPPWQPCTI